MRDQTLDGGGGRARAGFKFKTGFNRFSPLKGFGAVLMAFMSCSTQLTMGQRDSTKLLRNNITPGMCAANCWKRWEEDCFLPTALGE